jgi:hypothetical protein
MIFAVFLEGIRLIILAKDSYLRPRLTPFFILHRVISLMKKIILLLVFVFCITMPALAQESRLIPVESRIYRQAEEFFIRGLSRPMRSFRLPHRSSLTSLKSSMKASKISNRPRQSVSLLHIICLRPHSSPRSSKQDYLSA